jgi:tetratricopeptide (TPR) repeat protein
MQKERLALALPGIMGGILAVILGCIAFIFNYPSLGGSPEGAIAISPAAGGLLYILMGISSLLAFTLGSEKAARIFAALTALTAVAGLAAALIFHEWSASFLILLIAAASFVAWAKKRGCALLLALGLLGFLVGQASMTFLVCGWKTWTVPGLATIYSAVMLSVAASGRDPLHKQSSTRIWIYASLGMAVLLLATVYLVRAPDDVGAGINMAEGSLAEGLGFHEAAMRAYQLALEANRSDPRAWEGEGRALQALGREDLARECFDRAAELKIGSAIGSCSSCPASPEVNEILVPDEGVAPEECAEPDPGRLQAKIILPGDVRTFSAGESIVFQGRAICGRGPVIYLWRSSIDGAIGEGPSFSRSNLSVGWHSITLDVVDAAGATAHDQVEIGVAEPWACEDAAPKPKYFPPDTSCRGTWPNASEDCMEHEVCHAGLDYIVDDAIDCCDGTPIKGEACAYAASNSEGSRKRCRGLYLIKALGTEARYMKGYALFKACCSGYPECTRACLTDLAGTCAFREGFNKNVSNLSCRPEEWGLQAWRSDVNMTLNSAVLGMFPTHATVNILQTGVCIDYAAALTTLLRKAGYARDEVLTTASSGYNLPLLGSHPGHAYNIVKLPGEDKYYFVETTGNAEGISLQGLPGYFWFTGCFAGMPVRIKVHQWSVEYCNKTMDWGYSDAGASHTLPMSSMMGC